MDCDSTIADGLYTPPSDNSSVTGTVTATAEDISGTVEIKVIANDTSGEEFAIGASGTFDVPAGAATLYLGFHDFVNWSDEWGQASVQLSWNDGSNGSCSVPAKSCLFFAFSPDGASGPYEASVDDYRPVAVEVPEGATSVTISASGTWGCAGDHSGGPAGISGYTGPTQSQYMTAALHSANITTCSCELESLVGMWGLAAEALGLVVADAANEDNSVTAVNASKDLYVASNAADEAVISLDALVASTSGTAEESDVYLHIERSDGLVVFDGLLSECDASEVTLPITDNASEFTVTARLDEENVASDNNTMAGAGNQTVNVKTLSVKSLTVTDTNDTTNTATATTGTIPTLYAGQDIDGNVSIEHNAVFLPSGITDHRMRWQIKLDKGGFIGRDDFSRSTFSNRFGLTNNNPTATVTAWIDANGNKFVESNEQKLQVTIAGVRGGLDVTDALKRGLASLHSKYVSLTAVQKANLSNSRT